MLVGLVLALPGYVHAQGDAAHLYAANCSLCHGPDGSSTSASAKAMKAKDLRSDEVQKRSDADLNGIITKGQGKMPPFGRKLKPEQIQELVAYVRQLGKK
jgi:cytochrome c6